MRVPMVGAGGFIGSRIVGGVLLRRRFATCELIACDLAPYDADSWHNVDGLINAAVDCAEPLTLCTRPCADRVEILRQVGASASEYEPRSENGH